MLLFCHCIRTHDVGQLARLAYGLNRDMILARILTHYLDELCKIATAHLALKPWAVLFEELTGSQGSERLYASNQEYSSIFIPRIGELGEQAIVNEASAVTIRRILFVLSLLVEERRSVGLTTKAQSPALFFIVVEYLHKVNIEVFHEPQEFGRNLILPPTSEHDEIVQAAKVDLVRSLEVRGEASGAWENSADGLRRLVLFLSHGMLEGLVLRWRQGRNYESQTKLIVEVQEAFKGSPLVLKTWRELLHRGR